MEPTWHSPDSWQKDGSSISGITALKKGAWTSILKATETHNGKSTDVVIKTFAVPEDVLQNPERIVTEREKFLTAARLQLELTQKGARAWVKILRLSDDPANPSFSMEKCGPSVQDLIDNRAHLSAKDMYALVQSFLQGLMELKQRANRSHGNVKPSDVLSANPGQSPPFKLADPAAKGEEHSANDLYALGLLIYQLIEHREWDPLNPLSPTRNWARFGGRRERWVQFLNRILSPNGCHEPLEDVKKEAARLKPGSPVAMAALVMVALGLIAGGAVSFHFVMNYLSRPATGGTTTAVAAVPTTAVAPPVTQTESVDPAAKAAFEQAQKNYQALLAKVTGAAGTPRYDHDKSAAIVRDAKALVPDQLAPATTVEFKNAADIYGKATARLQEAVNQIAAEEEAGKQQESAIYADLTRAQLDYAGVLTNWTAAVTKFSPERDHARSQAMAQASIIPIRPSPADPAAARTLANDYRDAAGRLNEALAIAQQEETAGPPPVDSRSIYNQARGAYDLLQKQYAAAVQDTKDLDVSGPQELAEKARTLLAESKPPTDSASYRAATAVVVDATQQMQGALTLLEKLKKNPPAKVVDVTAVIAAADQAVKDKSYAEAFIQYQKAATLGNAPAMRKVGLFYEIGQGTPRDYKQAAQWYQKANAAGNIGAAYDLACLYETGRGVERDYRQARDLFGKVAAAKAPEASDAMNHVGYLYENGWGVAQNYAEALKWYKEAAALGNRSAIYNIGVIYDNGLGVRADYREAMTWYKKAADLNDAAAMCSIGVLYDNGLGTVVDHVEAMRWFKKAADLNYPAAMFNIGTLYVNGAGVTQEIGEALRWFRRAAELQHGLAMYNLAVMYEEGKGTAEDKVQAVQWYRKAYKSDEESARTLAAAALKRLGYAAEGTPAPR